MNIKKTICALLACLMAVCCALPALAASAVSASAAKAITITPAFSEGVTLEYEASAMSLNCSEVYGLLRVEKSKALTLTAYFAEGWTYNATYTNFFRAHSEKVTVADGADGSKIFTLNAEKGDLFTKDELLAVGIYATPESLPKLEINASVAFSQITKTEWVTADFKLTLGTKEFASGDYEGTGFVKGRGNTSWGQPKKPYSIKLDAKASLLDIPKTKKYAIVPSYSDPSLIRNYVAYKSGLSLEGIDYVPKCEFVDVYLNGTYNGIYLLVERVAIESNKIDIEDATAEELTGGYLIEKDINGKIDFTNDLWFDCPYWANPSKDYFVLKDPDVEDSELWSRMRSYLTGYMQSLHNAVMGSSEEPYTKYVDVSSWIDFIIVQELSKNIDGNLKTSCYMFKAAQDDKLYMTAPWDFDLAFGNPATTWNNASSQHNDYSDCPDAQSTSDFMVINSSCPWFDTLYDDHEEFRAALCERYTAYRADMIPSMLALMDYAGAYLSAASVANDAKWNTDFNSGVTALRTWLTSRIEWLDGQWRTDQEEIDLDFALNAAGGTLHFDTSNYAFTGVTADGRIAAVSGNTGVHNSKSTITLTLDMQAGETLSFNYKVSSETNYDFLTVTVNGTQIVRKSGAVSWTSCTYTAQTSGSYTFIWEYSKDRGVSTGSDCAWVDEVSWSGQPQITLLGDADCSGEVDFVDISLMYLFLYGESGLTQQGLLNADYDGDGTVTFTDITYISLGLIGD